MNFICCLEMNYERCMNYERWGSAKQKGPELAEPICGFRRVSVALTK
jgi:hypothetical protein